jgi:hypothetical protein
MDLTAKEVCVLLMIYMNNVHAKSAFDDYDEIINSLIQKGLIYSQSGHEYIVTAKAKERIGNNILKERNLPDYINKYSFPEAFDKFFTTASPNAINTLLLSWLNSKKFQGLNPITLRRIVDVANTEINQLEINKPKVNLTIK